MRNTAVLVLLVVFVLCIIASCAQAGRLLPSCAVSVGNAAGLSSNAMGMFDPNYVSAFDPAYYIDSRSYVALWSWDGAHAGSTTNWSMNSAGLPIPYHGYVFEFHIWSGVNELRDSVPFTVDVLDPSNQYNWNIAVFDGYQNIFDKDVNGNFSASFEANSTGLRQSLSQWDQSQCVVYITATPVPEPATVLALITGLACFGTIIKRKR